MDNKNLKAFIKGWTPSMVTTQDGTQSLKPEDEWSKDKIKSHMEILELSTPYSMELTNIHLDSSTHVPLPKKLERHSTLLMKAPL